MIELKCPSCGAAMIADVARKEAHCPYCGSSCLLELAKDEKEKLNIIAEPEPDLKQVAADTFLRHLYTADGNQIDIECLMQKSMEEYEVFISRDHILYRFYEKNADMAMQMVKAVSLLLYPSEDMQKKMHYYLPNVTGTYDLQAGEKLVVLDKLKYVYPLSLVDTLDARHMAWIVSRLENLACLLDYSGITIEGLTSDDVYMEPIHHQVLLYGGWYKAKASRNGSSILKEIRQIARDVVCRDGKHFPNDMPEALKEFLSSRPKSSATDDFAYWDSCLDRAYAKREFVELTLTEREVYR